MLQGCEILVSCFAAVPMVNIHLKQLVAKINKQANAVVFQWLSDTRTLKQCHDICASKNATKEVKIPQLSINPMKRVHS